MRRKKKFKRAVRPDFKYNNELVALFINHLMWGGKKSIARSIMYKALEDIKQEEKGKDPIAIFNTAVSNVAPMLEVKSRRVGGATYQIPCEVRGDRRNTLAMRWIIGAARAKRGRPMPKKLAEEILLASKNQGDAVKKRENTHKMAEANKAFAHFAW
ncbi:MAG: 30S ribosomal protein S7 [Candidatus Ryanbacteria bacterium RIFCSPHIGHO2_02_FULL_45_43]|uniref:Small ribosomal subunit protein uS7 n=1 Tax=Candidatus Ryanbacteria bacterium RIFCSPHIGHO2_01_45_13 TaxID=1802112 RepID=A0A1G2FYH8_9BACT|nr:MAG: 30S ribosomal protein S7 [Candidatus Ryanbacteria bacterium RIFCSPHIGHO2_01_FULL_44_130]OGZ43123.1 MAG: 30S ribosomal protein S7 [Candidatus Ryanbacteria bacterium RIFCSPHIGHO2_01_45_13]OGZ47802.1 MAG: 30S ribosomal protein S7 [Candidatus Ryanbacteria bacterium RIFCSPHIGHO2_02_FULL_45_43]OGZ49695.1 MAG: 30S ribosomal protein S7 [Candidatus Ryanbacteria bacterium RIFCSPHIGHO2_12_FULL_44_20]OGZ52188.1 MAG: 30S ribosomal protein S7 [Candidatus Ryanbacteria bacterium RIFCSPLOWO2_01_FULL_44_